MRRGPRYHHCGCGHATLREGAPLPLACGGCGAPAARYRDPPIGGVPVDGRPRVSLGEGNSRILAPERDVD